jgi:hypothetical protein
MSEAAMTPRFTLDFVRAGSSAVVASASYDDPEKALQAYRQASEEFRASKQPPGASLSLNDQKLEFHGGAVSEGLGVSRVGWLKDSARERFEQLAPVAEDRPELAALRAAFAAQREHIAAPGADGPRVEPMQIAPADLQRVSAARARDVAQAVETLAIHRDTGTAKAEPAKTGPALATQGGTIEAVERVAVKEQGADVRRPTETVDASEKEDALRKRYLRTDQGYHDKQTMELVIVDKGNKLSTQREDVPTVDALATAAADRGWTTVAVSGTEAFKREAWYQMAARGIEVTGYSPTPADKARLAEVGREQPAHAPAAAAKDKAQEKTAPIPARSPVKEAAEAVRQLAPDIAIESPATPREDLAVNAAANAAHGAAVAANERAREGVQGRGADLAKPPQKAQELQQPKLSGEQQVMINAVDRVLREGGLSAEQRERVRQVATKNVSEKNPEVKPPKVADRAAIPQPVASNGPKQSAKRDLSR